MRFQNPERVLFVAHTEQILRKAAEEFALVLDLDESDIGFLSGQHQDFDTRFLFATVQSLSRPYNLKELHRDAFDYIVIDEVHRSGAESYRKVIDYFTPGFLLGLTATPERTDGFDIYELFHWNVAFEIRLQAALNAKMLVPLHYYGISDYSWITDHTSLENRLNDERLDFITTNLEIYGFARDVKGLIFCSSNEESHLLAEKLNSRSVHGRLLRTRALSGEHSITEHEAAIEALASGELDYLITVNIFNEGIDIPPLNQIVMMRGTESSIIFTQKLGRGLRKAEGKDHLRVLDFIGNYENSYLIPVALSGDHSGNKDNLREIVGGGDTPFLPATSTVNFDRIASSRIL